MIRWINTGEFRYPKTWEWFLNKDGEPEMADKFKHRRESFILERVVEEEKETA